MLPFGHLIFVWMIGLLIQKISNIKISNLGWGLLFFGGILPDVDYLFVWIFNNFVHRTFTHSLVFVLLSFFVVYYVLKNYKFEKEAIFISLGILCHIFLDMFFRPGVMLFWPIGTWFSFYGLSNYLIVNLSTLKNLNNYINFLIFDIGLGIIWLGYLYIKGNIKFN
jgi:membrane-bound metal-dependent hydrolase YbcI (DUF457 family)